MPGGGRHAQLRSPALPSADEDSAQVDRYHLPVPGGSAERQRGGGPGAAHRTLQSRQEGDNNKSNHDGLPRLNSGVARAVLREPARHQPPARLRDRAAPHGALLRRLAAPPQRHCAAAAAAAAAGCAVPDRLLSLLSEHSLVFTNTLVWARQLLAELCCRPAAGDASLMDALTPVRSWRRWRAPAPSTSTAWCGWAAGRADLTAPADGQPAAGCPSPPRRQRHLPDGGRPHGQLYGRRCAGGGCTLPAGGNGAEQWSADVPCLTVPAALVTSLERTAGAARGYCRTA